MRSSSAPRVATSTGVALLFCTLSAVAYGQDKKDKKPATKREIVVIFPLHSQLPDEDSRLPAKLTKVLERTVYKRGMRVTSAAASIEDMAALNGCSATDKECRTTMLEQLGAQRGMLGTVKPGDDPERLTVTVAQFDTSGASSRKVFDISRKRASREFKGVLPVLFGDPVPPEFASNMKGSGGDATSAGVRGSTWLVLGSGGAAVLVGTIFWLSASAKQSEIDEAPTATVDDLQRLAELEDSAQTRATAGNVLFFGGVAALGLGTYLAIRQAGSEQNRARARSGRDETSASARWLPTLLPGGAGVSFHAAF